VQSHIVIVVPLDIEAQLMEVRAFIDEHKTHVEALEKGETYVSRLTIQKSSGSDQKRKRPRNDNTSSSKRRKVNDDSDEEDIDMDDDDSFIVSDNDVSEYEMEDKDEDEDEDGDEDETDPAKSDSGSDVFKEDTAEEEPVTIGSLKAKIEEGKAAVQAGRKRLNEMRKAKKEAGDVLTKLKKEQSKAQKEKNAFCSLKRSEVCA